MNKRKVAVFVEGQAEYVFVRDFLCRWYDYDSTLLGIECFSLRSDLYNSEPYPFGDRKSVNYYQIVNVGNDRSVLSKMLKEAPRLQNAGFHQIIGLSDMYSDLYHVQTKERCIDVAVNQKLIDECQNSLNASSQRNLLSYHFAIMEVEAWILGMYQFLQQIDSSLTPQFIMSRLQIDITADPEISFYHPAKVLDEIYRLAGRQYGKHLNEIASITSQFSKDDYARLLASGHCKSFNEFIKDLVAE